MSRRERIETKLIHAGQTRPRIGGAVVTPLFQSAMFEYGGEKSYDEIRYLRLNNSPNHVELHAKLAALENAEDAVVSASGMAAISTALLSVLSAGDHLLAQDSLYGGTHDFITKDLAGFGIAYDFVDGKNPIEWKEKLKPNTKAFYVETITNPLLKVADLKEVAAFCKARNLISLVDNTFASPLNFRPSEHGFDISLHSCTKYLNGHSDIVAGACIGRRDLIRRITHKLNHLGGCLDPHAAFLLDRGMKTLSVRMRAQCENALHLAAFLENHPAVKRINYPGLPGNPEHPRAKALFDGFGGMLSFELKEGVEAADAFLARLTIPIVAPSLGGVESLVTRPATTSHSGMSRKEREERGITDSLIRVSVGIEAKEDLIEDFDQALKSLAKDSSQLARKTTT